MSNGLTTWCRPHRDRGIYIPATEKNSDDEPVCQPCFQGQPPLTPVVSRTDLIASTPVPQTPVKVVAPPFTPAYRIKDQNLPAYPPRAKKENPVTETKEVNWAAVQIDRDGGMKIAKIAAKYGVPQWKVYAETKPKNKSNVTGNPAVTRPVRTGTKSHIAATLEDLRAQRDKLNAAIEILEQLC